MDTKILKKCGHWLAGAAKNSGKFIKRHKSSICAAGAVACGIGGMYEVHKAEPKALTILSQHLEKKAADPNDNSITMEKFYDEGVPIEDIPKYFTLKERIKLTWPCYTKSIIMGVGTVGTGTASIVTGEKAIAGLTAAVKLSEEMNDILREEAKKELGDEKFKEVDKRVTEKVRETPAYAENQKRNGDTGKLIPMRDEQFGFEFMATEDMVRSASCQAGQVLLSSDYCSVDTFLDFLRESVEKTGGYLPRPDLAIRCSFNWEHRPDVSFGDGRWEDGTPCRTVSYDFCIEP